MTLILPWNESLHQTRYGTTELGISEGGLHNWVRQDRVDRGEVAGVTTIENMELQRARKRIRELELQVEILTKASEFLTEERPHPKGFTR